MFYKNLVGLGANLCRSVYKIWDLRTLKNEWVRLQSNTTDNFASFSVLSYINVTKKTMIQGRLFGFRKT